MKRVLSLLIILSFYFPSFGQWVQTSGPEGPVVNDLERINNEIWAATNGGLYISSDEGQQWRLADFLPTETLVKSIYSAGNEVLLVTSQYDFTLTSYYDAWTYQLYRSTDAGLTWTIKELPINTYESREELAVTKVNNSIIVTFIQFFANDFFRSNDNGDSWEEISVPSGVRELTSNGERLLATSFFDSYLSYDVGETWEFLESIGSDSELFMEGDRIVMDEYWQGISISEDSGASWTSVPSPGIVTDSRFRAGDAGKIYFLNNNVYGSEDGGYTWSPVNNNTPNNAQEKDVLDQLDGGVLLGSNKGIFRTPKNLDQWVSSNKNLLGVPIQDLMGLPNGDILARTDLRYFRTPNGGDNWFEIDFPFQLRNRFESIVVKGDSLFVFGNSNEIYLSTDNFYTFELIDSFFDSGTYKFKYVNDRFYLLDNNSYYSYDLINWEIIEISDPSINNIGDIDDILYTEDNVLLASTDFGHVFRSEDGGNSWNHVLEFFAPGVTDNYLYEVGDRIFLIDNNDWFYSVDQGLSWNTTAMTGLPVGGDNFFPTEIALVDNSIYASVFGKGVYVSNDLGETWTPNNDGLDGLLSTTILTDNDRIYLGTLSSGVWRSGAGFPSVGGTVYHDSNSNGIWDYQEEPMEEVLLKSIQFNSYTSSNNNGIYNFFTDTFGDTIRAFPVSPYAVVQPEYYVTTQPATNLDFGISFIADMNDLSITLTTAEPFRPGFETEMFITVKNIGTTTISPTIKLPINTELTFINANPVPTLIDMDTLIWELPPLSPSASVNITGDFYLDLATPLGDLLVINTEVLPLVSDENLNNNSYTLVTEVVESYDPNDKQVEPLGVFTPQQVNNNEALIYQVRFQNTGTFLAENVRIIDTLSEKLDLASFKLLSASHPVEWNVREDNIIEFIFENIMLPDSTTNFEESNGFVKFSVETEDNLVLGDEIPNFADIYFDFNEPIRTNTTRTVFDLETSVNQLVVNEKELFISPNPTSENCFLSIEEEQGRNGILRFFDVQGILIFERTIFLENTPKMVDLERMAPGFYTIKFEISETEIYEGRLIVH